MIIPPPGNDTPQEAPRNLDAEALTRQIESYRTYLLFVAGKLRTDALRDREGASDLVQQAMMSAIATIREGRARLPGGDSTQVRAWLRRILINTHRDLLRHHFAQQRSPDREHRDGPLELAADSSSPISKVVRIEETERLEHARSLLDDRERKLLTWWFEDELSFTQIAQNLQCSVSGARKACFRAAQRLKSAYESGDGPEGKPKKGAFA